MLRYFFLAFLLICIFVVALAGWRGQTSTRPPLEIFPDMDHQPRVDAQAPSKFFADGRSIRQPVAGTVPIGYVMPHTYFTTGANNNKFAKSTGGFSASPDYFDTGKIGDSYGDGIPLEPTAALMARGRERFTINCAICHGATAAGDGIVKQYGMNTIATLQDTRIRTMPDGQIFNTITHGKNTMGAYGSQITVEDRWAIIVYLRALQRSQGAKVDDVPQEQRAELDKTQEAAKP